MRLSHTYTAAAVAVLASLSTALQVSPSSPCASACLDISGADPSDPNNSNTLASDISCRDADYTSTAVGQKFQKCMTCLQKSDFTSGSESDQAWFIYNLRYTLDECLYGFPQNQTTIGGPCLTDQACGPLANALKTGSLDPGSPTYDYCTADGSSFSGNPLTSCSQCLHDSQDIVFLSNFVTALEAGCQQKPTQGVILGLNDTVFTTAQITITTAVVVADSHAKSNLSTGVKVAIAVGGTVLLLLVLGTTIICVKKRRRRNQGIESGLNSRFGATNITAPSSGAYSNPFAPPPRTAQRYPPMPRIPKKHIKKLSLHNAYDMEKAAVSVPNSASLPSLYLKPSRPQSTDSLATHFSTSSTVATISAPPSPEPSPFYLHAHSMTSQPPSAQPSPAWPIAVQNPTSSAQPSPAPPPPVPARAPSTIRSGQPSPSAIARAIARSTTPQPVPVHPAYIPSARYPGATSPIPSPPLPEQPASAGRNIIGIAKAQFSPPGTKAQFSPPGTKTQFSPPGTKTQFSPPGTKTQFSPPGTKTQFSPPIPPSRSMSKSVPPGANRARHLGGLSVTTVSSSGVVVSPGYDLPGPPPPPPPPQPQPVNASGLAPAEFRYEQPAAPAQSQPQDPGRMANVPTLMVPVMLGKPGKGRDKGKDSKKSWSPDSPESVEQWPGSM